MSLILKWEISFTDLYIPHENISPTIFLPHQPWVTQPNKVIYETPIIFKANYWHICNNSFMGNTMGKQKMQIY